jgi:hypothetical protein
LNTLRFFFSSRLELTLFQQNLNSRWRESASD